jgi:hypothetical protein
MTILREPNVILTILYVRYVMNAKIRIKYNTVRIYRNGYICS